MTTIYPPPPLGQTNPPIYYTPSMMTRPDGATVFVAHADYFNKDKAAPMVTFVYKGETVVVMVFYHPIDARHEFEWFLNDPEGWITIHHYPPPVDIDEESDEESEGKIAEVGGDFKKRPAFIPLKPGRVLPGPWEVREVGPNV